MQFLPSSGHVDTAIWMHYIDTNKTYGEKLDSNYTRMLWAILNSPGGSTPKRSSCTATYHPSWKLSKLDEPAGHYWRSRDELVSDVLLWTPSQGRAKAGDPARTYIQQLCADTGCSPADLPEAMSDRQGWRERVRISVLIAGHDDDEILWEKDWI